MEVFISSKCGHNERGIRKIARIFSRKNSANAREISSCSADQISQTSFSAAGNFVSAKHKKREKKRKLAYVQEQKQLSRSYYKVCEDGKTLLCEYEGYSLNTYTPQDRTQCPQCTDTLNLPDDAILAFLDEILINCEFSYF